MNFEQLRAWANNPSRTPADFRLAASNLPVDSSGTDDEVKTKVLVYIASQPDLTAASPWTPPGWTAAPVPMPAPVAPATTSAPAAGGHGSSGWKRHFTKKRIATTAAVAAVIAVLFLAWNQDLVSFGKSDEQAASSNQSSSSASAAATTTSGSSTDSNGKAATGNQTNCPGDHEAHAGDTYNVPAGCTVKGDVMVLRNGNFVKEFDEDPATGLLVVCPSGCQIKTPFGANISPSTVSDLKLEMEKSGCGNGCKSVKVITIGDSPKTASSASGDCGFEMKPGDVRTIPSGCIIVGDVFARKSSSETWVWTTDQQQNTGSVQKLSTSLEIRAPYGAAVYNSSYDVNSLIDTTKELGCHTGNGCTEGVKGWIKTP